MSTQRGIPAEHAVPSGGGWGALLRRAGSSPSGLSSAEASRRARALRLGALEQNNRRKTLHELYALVTNPLIVILFLVCLVDIFLGQTTGAVIILVILGLSLGINAYQTFQTQHALEKLRAQTAPAATVLRDGQWREVPKAELVAGDIVALAGGDLVPADCRLLAADNLHIQQSALTGESLPAEKQALPEAGDEKPAPDHPAFIFLGTSVVSGTGTAVVLAAGAATRFGDLASRLALRRPETEFERGLRDFGSMIMRFVVFLTMFVFAVNIVLRHDPMEALLFAVALAVGLTPEFLPMITTVTLAKAAIAMSKQRVLVKHLSAVQNLGSIDILCSDKTGTLTASEMSLQSVVGPFGATDEAPLRYALLQIEHKSGMDTPLDTAIRAYAASHPIDPKSAHAARLVDELPFDFERRRASVVVEREGRRFLVCKGAPESVLPISTHARNSGLKIALDPEDRAKAQDLVTAMCQDGNRVLAIAMREVPEQDAYSVVDERELELLGFLAFFDPPLPGVGAVLKALAEDGVAVKILSGDNELVVRHICGKVGLDMQRVLNGDELERMNDLALAKVAESTVAFARLSPAQKDRILQALRWRGHVVGFLGDGINDASSLYTADVGISVSTAVEVAKEAADIILLESSLAVLHRGIQEGRKAFGNVMKYMLMETSSNFGNMVSMALASLFLPFLPMLPAQILLNNFIYDAAQVTIPTDRVDDSMLLKPRRWSIRLIRDFMLTVGPLSSIFDVLTFFLLLKVFRAPEAFFQTGWFIESLLTQVLVIFVIRTAGSPLRNRASTALTVNVLVAVLAGVLIPFTPLGALVGFVAVPASYIATFVLLTASYLVLVNLLKYRIFARVLA